VKGASAVRDRTFFWRIHDQDAVRKGNWKYFRDGTQRRLFDLSFDSHEQADFSRKNPELFKQLTAEFEQWNAQMLPRRQDNN
jgi:arylsulfatase A-like enzyme